MKNKQLYYAHPIDLYGTQQEKRDVELLGNVFTDYVIFNPNSDDCEDGYALGGMEYFYNIVEQCDLVVFRGYPGGRIPAGVAGEVERATKHSIPVLELPTLVDRALSVEDTRRYIREIGTR